MNKVYGPISVIHFDAHLDTWVGTGYNGATSPQSQIVSSLLSRPFPSFSPLLTALPVADPRDFLLESVPRGSHCQQFDPCRYSNSALGAFLRALGGPGRPRFPIESELTPLPLAQGFEDLENDVEVGFQLLTTDDIDELKPTGIIEKIKQRVGNTPTYLSFDIDTIDPSMAPASELQPSFLPPPPPRAREHVLTHAPPLFKQLALPNRAAGRLARSRRSCAG